MSGARELRSEAGRSEYYTGLAQAVYAARGRLAKYLPGELFNDPARDILLDLFITTEKGASVSVTSCAHGARVPLTTAMRCIALLEERGLVVRSLSERDKRVRELQLTDAAQSDMRRYLDDVASLLSPFSVS